MNLNERLNILERQAATADDDQPGREEHALSDAALDLELAGELQRHAAARGVTPSTPAPADPRERLDWVLTLAGIAAAADGERPLRERLTQRMRFLEAALFGDQGGRP